MVLSVPLQLLPPVGVSVGLSPTVDGPARCGIQTAR
jgi:hypothetical protein